MHSAGDVLSSHTSLRQRLVPVVEQVAPIGLLPTTAVGGMHTFFPLRDSHVYPGVPTQCDGQSAAVVHSDVQPSPVLPQNPSPDGHSVATPHGFSMFTQIFTPPAEAQAKPAGQSAPVEHECVQCDAPAIPPQYSTQPAALVQAVPVSSMRQTPPPQI